MILFYMKGEREVPANNNTNKNKHNMRRLINNTTSALLGLLIFTSCSDITNNEVDSVEGLTANAIESSSTTKSDFEDADNNGIPDEGEVVTGAYKALYAEDANGDYYFDLGDGRVLGTVDSVDELDQETLTVCEYKIQYRGAFENDPFLDNGWIKNQIKCSGYDYDKAQTFNFTIVHETDPRYTGNPDWAIWNTWEYHTNVVGGVGNLVRPETHVN